MHIGPELPSPSARAIFPRAAINLEPPSFSSKRQTHRKVGTQSHGPTAIRSDRYGRLVAERMAEREHIAAFALHIVICRVELD